MNWKLIPVGTRFGRLVVTGGPKKEGRVYKYPCHCDCGNDTWTQGIHLRVGHSTSCGCKNREAHRNRLTSHGLTEHPIYTLWQGIKRRCNDPKMQNYDRYGARGIKVCRSWMKAFQPFYDWCVKNGYKKGLQIDRKNNQGEYSPVNCRFVTQTQNARNKRNNKLITFAGRTMTMIEWSEECGIPYRSLFYRLKAGWKLEDALTKPLRKW